MEKLNTNKERQELICRILGKEQIGTQQGLLEALEAHGVMTTQATLSRDLRKLGISRTRDANGQYTYKLSPTDIETALSHQPITTSTTGYKGYTFSGEFLLVQTLGGYARAIASKIDYYERPEIAGTIAGDNCVLVLPNDGYGRDDLARAIVEIIAS